MNSITEIEIKQLAEATASLYTRLTDGLNHITLKNGWIVLLEMKQISYIHANSPAELLDFNNLCPYNIGEDQKGKFFKCACGKKHISKLSIMEYKGEDFEYILIGSECINTLNNFTANISGIDNLKEKFMEWSLYIKEEEHKINFKECVCCKKYKVNKKYDYKKEHRKYWCNDC